MQDINDGKSATAAVIGGGVAGMVAALRLAESGVDVTLFEQKARLGGRMFSFYDAKTEDVVDNGQHLMVGAYAEFFDFLRAIGTYDLLPKDSIKTFTFATPTGRAKLDAGRFKGKAGLLTGLISMKGVTLSAKYAAMKFATAINSGYEPESDMTARDVLNKYEQDQRFTEIVWDPLVVSTINVPPEKASGRLFVNTLREGFLSGEPGLIIPKTNLSDLFKPFAEKFKGRGGRIYFSTPIQKLEHNGRRYVAQTSAETYEYDYIITAVEPHSLSKALNGAERDLREKLGLIKYSPILSVYLWLEGETHFEPSLALPGEKFDWLFDRDALTGKQNDMTRLAFTKSAADEYASAANEDIAEICLELAKKYGSSPNVKLKRYIVINDPRATALIDPATESMRENLPLRLSNLYITGDWTLAGLPATIETAARSGNKAAREIIARIRGERR